MYARVILMLKYYYLNQYSMQGNGIHIQYTFMCDTERSILCVILGAFDTIMTLAYIA